ncbi:sialate O-acetylesterase [uncultured Shewanella sp.]|uniref:sialate O-acetylesterase n=1 Tax=uncultured Shewanella sp. TaxID=173975 RepID=UPI002601DFD5|nr:sialate O-acetylesterase [uncultured Shewanella sp.]
MKTISTLTNNQFQAIRGLKAPFLLCLSAILFGCGGDGNGDNTAAQQEEASSTGGNDDNSGGIQPPSNKKSNHLPIASNQAVQMAAHGRLAKSIFLAAYDADLDPLQFSIQSPPAHGSLTGSGQRWEYLPKTNFSGIDSFSYMASDSHGTSNIATVTIAVKANDCASDFLEGPSDNLLVHVPSHLEFRDIAGGNAVIVEGTALTEKASSDPEVKDRTMFVSRNDFNNADMTLSLPQQGNLANFSLSFKFIPDNADTNDTLVRSIADLTGKNNAGNFYVGTNNGGIVGQLGDQNNHTFSNTASTLKTRSCNHLTMTVDNGILTTYVNGEVSSSITINTDSYSDLGDMLQFGPFAGKIWDVRLYKRTLSYDDIMALGGDKCNNTMIASSPFDGYNNYLCSTYQCQWWTDDNDKSMANFEHYIVAQERVWERNIFEAGMYEQGKLCRYFSHEGATRDLQLSEGISNTFVKDYTLENKPLTQSNAQHWMHENFHSYQAKLNRVSGQASGKYTLESSASWGADHNIPGVRDSLLGYYSLHPHISLWAIQDSPVDHQYGHEFKGGHQYGAYVFWSWLTNYAVSKDLMGGVFRDSQNGLNDLEAANAYITAQGHDMKALFADFAAHITTWDMVEGEAYQQSEVASLNRMQSAFPDAGTHNNKLTQTFSSEGTGNTWTDMDKGYVPGSWAFNAFKVEGITEDSNYTIAVRANSDTNPAHADFRGRAVVYNPSTGSRTYYPFDIDSSGEISGTTIPVPAEHVLYALVITTPDTFRNFEFYDYDFAIFPSNGEVNIDPIEGNDSEDVVKVVVMAGQSNMEGNNTRLDRLQELICHANADYTFGDVTCGSTTISEEQISAQFINNTDALNHYHQRLNNGGQDATVTKLGQFLCRVGSLDSLPNETCNKRDFDLTDRLFATISGYYFSTSNGTYGYGYDAWKQMTTAMAVASAYDEGQLSSALENAREDVTVLQYQGALDDTGSLSFSQRYGALLPNYGVSSTRFGPELSFGHYLGDNTESDLLLLKVVQGGTDLRVDWKVPGCHDAAANEWTQDEKNQDSLYSAMLEKINALRDPDVLANYFPQYANKTIKIDSFIWFQGWNDGGKTINEDNYETNLTCLVNGIREALNDDDLPIIITKSHYGDPNGAIQEAQQNVANTVHNVEAHETDDLSGYYHYDPAAQLTIGKRMKEARDTLP